MSYRKQAAFYRRAYRKLPWGVRVADMVYTIYTASVESDFGRLVYTVFLRQGVPDMPGGLTAEDVKGRRMAPVGYGSAFGKMVFRRLLAKYHDPEVIHDAMQEVAMRLIDPSWGKAQFNGRSLKSSQAFVIRLISNRIKDKMKSPRYNRTDSLSIQEDDDASGVSLDLTDPSSLRRLDDILSPSDYRRMKNELNRRVHPEAGKYLDLLLQGYSMRDILNRDPAKRMIDYDKSFQTWSAYIYPKIKEVLRKYLH